MRAISIYVHTPPGSGTGKPELEAEGSMDSAKRALISTWVLLLLLLSLIFSSSTLVVAPFAILQLSRGLPVTYSPNSKPGTSMVCERVHIRGLLRIKNLRKFAQSLSLKVSWKDSSVLLKAEECVLVADGRKFPMGRWLIPFRLLAHSISPFGYKLLDICTTNSSLESFDVSIEEEFFPHRVIYLVLGIIMMSLAPILSNSLWQCNGNWCHPSDINCFFSGNEKGNEASSNSSNDHTFNLFICSWFSVISLLPLSSILAFHSRGEDGSIDLSTSHFVAWSIQILAALLILQSSVDPVVATEALAFGILVSSLFRRILRLRILCRINRSLTKLAKRKYGSHVPGLSASEDAFDKYTYKIRNNEYSNFLEGC
ncbi:NEMP family [Trema orientale]|uniref:NEMP family n=1 Tax=Trema orientale TaxID=63057 RepID=A0A2P5CCL3_TREOI|nr:NEMP family [Trema orientale]